MTDEYVSTLRSIMKSPHWVLRDDVMVRTVVQQDSMGNTKVYEGQAPVDTAAPYVVTQLIPTLGDQTGVYGDDDVIKIIYFQATAWATSEDAALNLADAVHEALRIGDWAVDPWQLMKVRMEGMPEITPDRDTSLWGVRARYRAIFGR